MKADIPASKTTVHRVRTASRLWAYTPPLKTYEIHFGSVFALKQFYEPQCEGGSTRTYPQWTCIDSIGA